MQINKIVKNLNVSSVPIIIHCLMSKLYSVFNAKTLIKLSKYVMTTWPTLQIQPIKTSYWVMKKVMLINMSKNNKSKLNKILTCTYCVLKISLFQSKDNVEIVTDSSMYHPASALYVTILTLSVAHARQDLMFLT